MRKIGVKGQIDFTWIFAILAGGAILFLAIFGAMRAGDTARYQSDTEIAKQITILTDPLQAGFASGSFGSISFNDRTRINNFCYPGDFGKNELSVSTRSDIGQEWNPASTPISVYNKYIFSNEMSEGIDYYVFSKPFSFPFKIADLIFMTSEDYCFLDVPEDLEEELSDFAMPNIEINNCTNSEAKKVCFSSTSGCDIVVSGTCTSRECSSRYDKGMVVKKGSNEDVYFVGNLMYAAIFADSESYNCNVERLLYRAIKITEVLIEKSDIMRAKGCSTTLKSDLISWKGSLNSTSIANLDSLLDLSLDLEEKNEREVCGLW